MVKQLLNRIGRRDQLLSCRLIVHRASCVQAAPLLKHGNQMLLRASFKMDLDQHKTKVIWCGKVEFQQRVTGPPFQPLTSTPKLISSHCTQTLTAENEVGFVSGDGWPPKLILQWLPEYVISKLVDENVQLVDFHFQICEELNTIFKQINSNGGSVGLLHFMNRASNCTVGVMMLDYSKTKQSFVGIVPNDQNGFMQKTRTVITQLRNKRILDIAAAAMRQQEEVENGIFGNF